MNDKFHEDEGLHLRKYLQDEAPVNYPDFEAMWERIQLRLSGSEEQRIPANGDAPRRGWFRNPALLVTAGVLAVATPVFAAISYNWDQYFHPQSGIRSVLQQGLGQSIEQTATVNDIQVTVHTAVVDDNRTVLLFSMQIPGTEPKHIPHLKMSLLPADGRTIDGNQRMRWDGEHRVWRGYFETEWTPETTESHVRFSVQDFRLFSSAERDISFDPRAGHLQTIPVGADGIDRLSLQSFDQGDVTMIASSTFFAEPEAQTWASPRIAVFRDEAVVKEAHSGAFGKPGDQGEYTGQQYYHTSDLQHEHVAYKLLYTKLEREVPGEWRFDLQLDKQQMQSGTVRRELGIPIESQGGRMVLKEMVITPTQIRIVANHARHGDLPYVRHRLEAGGTELQVGSNRVFMENPETTTFRYELPPGVHVSAQTPIVLKMEYEVVRHDGGTEPIHLPGIGEEKKTITTDVGGFPVQWTYYKQDGDLYVLSESADPHFGGINQTYMKNGTETTPGKPITTNFSGDGINRAIDRYENFAGTEADIYIYYYSVDDPEQGIRVDLTKGESSQ